MLQSIEGIYRHGIIELLEMPVNIEESRVIVTFLEIQPIQNSQQMIYFGMFAGENQSSKEDFLTAQFRDDQDDNLDWS